MPRKSLKEVHPELLDEWDYEKNDELGLYPDKVSYGSAKKPWWKCKVCGHEWQAAVFNRVAGYGCPECGKRRISEKKATPKKGNSLGEKYPELAKEWNQEKNGTVTPFDVTAHSGQIVWWKCEKGHEWQSAVNNRSGRGQGCPLCFAERQTSFPEQAILYFLERDLKTPVLNRYRYSVGDKKYEIDIYIPKYKVGIEYDGSFWHKGRENYDLEKSKTLKENGVKIIRVKESDYDSVNGDIIFYKYDKGKGYKTLSWVIEKIENSLGCNPSQSIDIVDSNIDILNRFKKNRLEGSLASSYPEIAAEWDYDKNDGLSPEQFTPSSNTKVWWICQNGHSWKTSINHRTNGQGCPYCTGRKLLVGFNDLASQRPDLAKEWDFEANEGLLPSQVNIHSTKKRWWICGQCGYRYTVTVTQRVNGRGCPKCAGKVVVAGDNDLATLYPEIAKEWDWEKNENLKPSEFLPGSHKKVWWKCSKCQHEWQAMIYSRTVDGQGCPKCAGQVLVPGENDLATLYPEIAKEWDWEKNKSLKPSAVRPGTDKRVWWRCSKCGHEWLALIYSRTGAGQGCPKCAGMVLVPGENDLATLYPQLEQEWDYEKNRTLKPNSVRPGSNKKVWWKCSVCGYEWPSTIYSRVSGIGCPACSGKAVIPGKNDLATLYPEVAKEWDYEKNKDLKPTKLKSGSNKSVWWKCSKCGFEWQAKIVSRALNGNGCPQCAGRVPMPGKNDLATLYPGLVKEWDYEKNKNLKPTSFKPGSREKVWWKCSKCGFGWQQEIYSRVKGSKCPKCLGRVVFKGENDFSTLHPELVKEWDFGKNKHLNPSDFKSGSCGSNKKVWWKCSKCGYEWEADIAHRVKGSGCPKCHGSILIHDENSLAVLNPKLAAEWNFERNKTLTPYDVRPGTEKKVWWKCSQCGYEWQAMIYSRSNGTGCPKCAGQVVISGENDLDTLYPDLAKEWNKEKNGKLKPSEVKPGSHKKVWWKCCKCGYEWLAEIDKRSHGQGCPKCSGKIVVPGDNDLATLFPDLAKEWHQVKNGDLKPSTVRPGSNKNVWWKCSKCGHEWEAQINKRSHGRGCPMCARHRERKKKV